MMVFQEESISDRRKYMIVREKKLVRDETNVETTTEENKKMLSDGSKQI